MDQGAMKGKSMEETILLVGKGVRQEVIGESLFDCVELAYRQYRGQRVELFSIRAIGYIDGHDLFVDPKYLDRASLKEIIALVK
jgi:hypothetical protein